MSAQGRDNPIVLASLDNGENLPPLRMRTATVMVVNKTPAVWTLTINLGGIDIPGITALGWYDPRVGDVVKVMQQGSEMLVLGTLAPGKIYAPMVVPPAPPAPPATPPPPAAITRRTVTVTADSSASWQSSSSTWRADFIQGGISSNNRRAFWFYGSKIAAEKGADTIIGGTIFVRRTGSGGVYQGANVRLGVHGLGSASGSGAGAHASVAFVGQLNKEQGATFALTAAHLAALNSGSYVGFGLEPGVLSYTSADYLVGYGRDAGDWSGSLSLTIEG